ncbi:MAG: T9SS type A sorting domain-containing protein [Bacteroidetes bacterium]|nr:T9SS type A sorting domain-containing protein [Bacteroidota bacterium]
MNCIRSTHNSNDNTSDQFSLYPNPATDEFTITVNSGRINQVSIYNVLGERVCSTIINSKSSIINLNTPNGIYFLELKTSAGIAVKKIVIEK